MYSTANGLNKMQKSKTANPPTNQIYWQTCQQQMPLTVKQDQAAARTAEQSASLSPCHCSDCSKSKYQKLPQTTTNTEVRWGGMAVAMCEWEYGIARRKHCDL